MILVKTIKQTVVYQVPTTCWILRRFRKAEREYLTASACLIKGYTDAVEISVLCVHWRTMAKCMSNEVLQVVEKQYDPAC